MLLRLVLGILFGGSLGALMGYFGKCTTGACPLTANPFRGAIYGAVLGAVFSSMLTVGNSAAKTDKENKNMVINLGSLEAFEKIRNSKGIYVVDFFAEWCYPCRLLAPVLDKIAEKYQGRVAFYKADINQLADLANDNGVEATPTVLIFKDGKEVRRLIGLQQEKDYISILDRMLGEEK